jgi:hypothetical protein
MGDDVMSRSQNCFPHFVTILMAGMLSMAQAFLFGIAYVYLFATLIWCAGRVGARFTGSREN